MRIPLAGEIDSRDGSANKDERLTNVLGEDNNGQQMATVRPGLAAIVTASGAGGSLTTFNGSLVSVFGTVVGVGEGPTSVGTVVAGQFDFCASPI